MKLLCNVATVSKKPLDIRAGFKVFGKISANVVMRDERTVQMQMIVKAFGEKRLFQSALEEPFPIFEDPFLFVGRHKLGVGKHGLYLHKMF